MTYGLCACGSCGRPRVVDLSKKTTRCPYCGTPLAGSAATPYYTSEDQAAVREALGRAYGFTPPDEEAKRSRIAESDPYSTLAYRYEHCSGLETKMALLAKGLTEIKGEFTMEDVRGIAGDKAEKLVSAMLDRCLVIEVRPGRYKA